MTKSSRPKAARRRWRLIVLAGGLVLCGLAWLIGSSPQMQERLRSTQTAAALVMSETFAAITASATSSATLTATISPSATITETTAPSATATVTATLTTEQRARAVLESVPGVLAVERLSVIEVGSPKLLAMDFPMPEGFGGYKADVAERAMIGMACALYAAGFDQDWRYQFSAMINLVSGATGQTFRDDGLTVRVSSQTIAGWACDNQGMLDAQAAMDEYILNPIMSG